MKLFKVVDNFSGSKKAVEGRSFSCKTDAKFFRDSLVANTNYDKKEDAGGNKMPFVVSKDTDHLLFNG